MRRATLAVFVATLAAFLAAPVRQPASDWQFTLLESVAILRDHTVSVERYLPSGAAAFPLTRTRAGLHSYFLPGAAVLSIPAVLIARPLGISPVDKDGRYDALGERKIAVVLAATLSAALVAIVFATARLVLSHRRALMVAGVAAFGTSVLSTLSRGLWSQTWSSVLITFAWYLVMSDAVGRMRLSPLLLGTALSWACFTRPTSIVPTVALVGVLLASPQTRRSGALSALACAGWFGGFLGWSLHAFGTPLPSYAQPSRLSLAAGFEPLLGNLVSPSHGLLVFSPIVAWVIYQAIVHRRQLSKQTLAIGALLACVAHILVIAMFDPWWGGNSYGPRLSADLLPSAIVLAILVLECIPPHRTALVLSSVSIAMNLPGALFPATWDWSNGLGPRVERRENWSLKRAQILAPFFQRQVPPPNDAPFLGQGLDLDDDPRASDVIVAGFGNQEEGFRWTVERHASLAFSLQPGQLVDSTLLVTFGTFLAPPPLPAQRVTIRLNGRVVFEDVLTDRNTRDLAIPISRDLWRTSVNELAFDVPDARSPASLGVRRDERRLGVALRHVGLVPGIAPSE